jgi:hypothetical protein
MVLEATSVFQLRTKQDYQVLLWVVDGWWGFKGPLEVDSFHIDLLQALVLVFR